MLYRAGLLLLLLFGQMNGAQAALPMLVVKPAPQYEIPFPLAPGQPNQPSLDQGAGLNTCVPNAITHAWRFQVANPLYTGDTTFWPSTLYIYYYQQTLSGLVPGSNLPGYISQGLLATDLYGAPAESLWPYYTKAGGKTIADNPASMIPVAQGHRVVGYEPVVTFDSMISHISQGLPVLFSLGIYDPDFASSFFVGQPTSFYNKAKQRNLLPVPAAAALYLFGHAALAVGYDQKNRVIKVLNSYGGGWGDYGYFYLPYDYFFTNTFEHYAITKVL